MNEQFKILGRDVMIGGSLMFIYRLPPWNRLAVAGELFRLSPEHRPSEIRTQMRTHLRHIFRAAIQNGWMLGLNDLFLRQLFADVNASPITFSHRLLCGALAGGMANYLHDPFRISWLELTGASVCRGLQLGVFGSLQSANRFKDDPGWQGWLSTYLAIQAATLLAEPLLAPFIKIDYNQKKTQQSLRVCLDAFINTHGWKNLFRKFPSRMLSIPSVLGCLTITTYDRIQAMIQHPL